MALPGFVSEGVADPNRDAAEVGADGAPAETALVDSPFFGRPGPRFTGSLAAILAVISAKGTGEGDCSFDSGAVL